MRLFLPKTIANIAGVTTVLPVILLVIFESTTAESTLYLRGGLQSQLVSIPLPPGSTAKIGAELFSLAIYIPNKDRSTLFAVIRVVILLCGLSWLNSHSLAYRFHSVPRYLKNACYLGIALPFKP
jgi:hypothetical protein